MNKILYAFNDISACYISEALEFKKARARSVNLRLVAVAACILLIFCVGVAVMLPSGNSNGPSVKTPQYVYKVGEKVTSSYGTCEYVAYTDTTVTFRIQSNRDWDYAFYILAYRRISENERITCVATTNRFDELGSTEVLDGALTIYIDGVEVETLEIPADGKVHEVLIDFGYLHENNYEVDLTWESREFARFALYENQG